MFPFYFIMQKPCVCLHARMHACTHACTHTHIYIYIYIYIFLYKSIFSYEYKEFFLNKQLQSNLLKQPRALKDHLPLTTTCIKIQPILKNHFSTIDLSLNTSLTVSCYMADFYIKFSLLSVNIFH